MDPGLLANSTATTNATAANTTAWLLNATAKALVTNSTAGSLIGNLSSSTNGTDFYPPPPSPSGHHLSSLLHLPNLHHGSNSTNSSATFVPGPPGNSSTGPAKGGLGTTVLSTSAQAQQAVVLSLTISAINVLKFGFKLWKAASDAGMRMPEYFKYLLLLKVGGARSTGGTCSTGGACSTHRGCARCPFGLRLRPRILDRGHENPSLNTPPSGQL